MKKKNRNENKKLKIKIENKEKNNIKKKIYKILRKYYYYNIDF